MRPCHLLLQYFDDGRTSDKAETSFSSEPRTGRVRPRVITDYKRAPLRYLRRPTELGFRFDESRKGAGAAAATEAYQKARRRN